MSGDLLQMTVYVGERARSGDRFTADALLDLYDAVPVAHSIVVRGIAGFGPRHELRSDVTLTGSEDPPIAVTAMGVFWIDSERREAATMISAPPA